MERLYTVTLECVTDMPAVERIAAELRFIKELEKSLGNADDVLVFYSAWREASEADASDVGALTTDLATRWIKAFSAAQRAGLKNVGEGDAHFKLQMTKHASV